MPDVFPQHREAIRLSIGTPAAEEKVDEETVRQLLRDQHPDLADETLLPIDAGWDNVMYRLGDDLVVRLPRRSVAVTLIENEQAWLPILANRLPIAIPAPVRLGRPSGSYPWPWSIVPWSPGRTADLEPVAANQARPFADFLRALHRSAPANAPRNEQRGVPLRKRAGTIEDRLNRLRDITQVITPRVLDAWKHALAAPEATASNWLHGDLHARNVVVENGVITGIIDWGDITAGDAATDLASVWMLFGDARARAECLARYQPSDALLARAKGWAVFFGTILVTTGLVDHPRHAAMGEITLQRLDEDGL